MSLYCTFNSIKKFVVYANVSYISLYLLYIHNGDEPSEKRLFILSLNDVNN